MTRRQRVGPGHGEGLDSVLLDMVCSLSDSKIDFKLFECALF